MASRAQDRVAQPLGFLSPGQLVPLRDCGPGYLSAQVVAPDVTLDCGARGNRTVKAVPSDSVEVTPTVP
jgi:hypothetical protein